ncbi:MAG: YcgN family cysteine cluster protein [Pseudomonadales bacterium]|nr:YcgN family cysteine cluster protein [Pseudomonadales bacterium]
MTAEKAFWKTTHLEEMSEIEWEALCDGCGQCCLHKLEDEDTQEVFYTDVACQLYDLGQGACKSYSQRLNRVEMCVKLTVELIPQFHWLPKTCAYRLLSEGQQLPDWHPLVSGRSQSVVEAGHSIVGKAVPEFSIAEDAWEERVITWVE